MESTISATTLARQLGDILGRVRYRGEAFVIERNGTAVARLVPACRQTASEDRRPGGRGPHRGLRRR
jgi:prevent-host-death family protein